MLWILRGLCGYLRSLVKLLPRICCGLRKMRTPCRSVRDLNTQENTVRQSDATVVRNRLDIISRNKRCKDITDITVPTDDTILLKQTGNFNHFSLSYGDVIYF